MENVGIQPQQYGEFKGSTEAKIDLILTEIKGLRTDVDTLKSWKAYTLGFGAMAGFAAAFLRDLIMRSK